jgi:hypothetical protein
MAAGIVVSLAVRGGPRMAWPVAAAAATIRSGVMAQLAMAGSIEVTPRAVTVNSPAAPGERLADEILGLIGGERDQHPAGEWLQYLAHTAPADVARRLAESGYLTGTSSRLPWRAGRWVPADSDCAFMPLNRARLALDTSRPVTTQTAALAGLATACGLEIRLLAYAPPRDRRSPQDARGSPRGCGVGLPQSGRRTALPENAARPLRLSRSGSRPRILVSGQANFW